MDSYASGVVAQYTPQRNPRYQGNPLIEALPPVPSEDILIELLTQLPEVSTDQMAWPLSERLQLVMSLSSFCVPLARHVSLALTIDSLIREGYVGRAPRTAAHTKTFQKLYEQQKAGVAFSAARRGAATLTTSLVGLSGMGKTTTLQRLISARFPEVIFHPDLMVWQIPCLHIETPHDGASVKGLAHAILRKVDQLIPDANYYETYALKSRSSVEMLLNHVARVLHIHCVGLLICDEIQNLENAPKNKQSLMTLLVSASNELGVPIVFVGTNKARRVLSLDFRQARRSVGNGLSFWDRLAKGSTNEPDEWDSFLEVLWQFQWTKAPTPLNPFLADLMYRHTQGIIDVAIKLFAACQWRAMLDGSEAITAQLIDDVANKELALVQPMIEALRDNDLKALESYDDIAPLDFDHLLRSAQARMTGKRVLGASLRPGDRMFAPAVSGVLESLGIDAETADALADQAEATGKCTNLLDATKQVIDQVMPPRAVRPSAGNRDVLAPLDPGDLRNAHRQADAQGTTAFAQLKKMGAVCDLRAVLPLH